MAPSTSKYSGAKLLDMITSFDGWKEALLELKALKNLTDFLNNPAKALQIKAMDLLEEFNTEKQVAMMQDGLVQALLQTVVVNEDEGVQSRALDYLSNISRECSIYSYSSISLMPTDTFNKTIRPLWRSYAPAKTAQSSMASVSTAH